MARIFFGYLLIFVINKQALSFEIFGIDFEEIKNLYNYANQLYEKTEELRESPTLEVEDQVLALHGIMNDLKGLSQQLVHIESDADVKLDTVVRVLLDNIEVSDDLRSSKTELLKHINHVEYLYNEGLHYDLSGLYSNETLKGFVNDVLLDANCLQETLFNIYALIFPGPDALLRDSFQSLSLSHVEANYERLCDRHISEQQRLFYTFMIIIHTQLKAFATITQAYAFQFFFERARYPHEYQALKAMFHVELTNYFDEFVKIIRYFPTDIRRCDVREPQLGVNILEFEGLFQVAVNTESSFRKKLHIQQLSLNYASGGCEDVKSDNREQFVVYNCKTTDSIRGCPVVNSNRIVRYSWWKTAAETIGHPYECPNSLLEVTGSNAGWSYNDVCVCSVNYTSAPLRIYQNDEYFMNFGMPKIMKISTEPQMSDIRNNMIVVGVKFVVHDNGIHLQIKQSKLLTGSVPTDSVWKPVDVDDNNRTIAIHYDILFDCRNIMNLDDVGIDPKYVVTGVRLQLNKEGNGYELNVHGTEYIHEENRLGVLQMWCKPGEYPINQLDYQRKRTEIHLNNPDDSSMINDYHSDPSTNKFIQFQHTSVQKDGGYHTVPFFDAQPVTIALHSPLSGIGLFHRGRDGFGGYIAPRLFSHNFNQILESSIKKWKEFDNIYKHCYHDEFNITAFENNAYCLLFGRNTKKIVSRVGTSVNIGPSYVKTNHSSTVAPQDQFSNNSTEIRTGHLVTNHPTFNETSSLAGSRSTVEPPPLYTDNSVTIAASRSTGVQPITASLSLSGGSSIITPSPPLVTNHPAFTPVSVPTDDRPSTELQSSAIKHVSIDGPPHLPSDSSVTITTFRSTGDHVTTKRRNPVGISSTLIEPRHVISSHFSVKSRNRSQINKHERNIERPLKLLRRNKSSIPYICNSNKPGIR